MAQGVLPFQYESDEAASGMTALAGLPVYLDLMKRMRLRESISRHIRIRSQGQGWRDEQIAVALILLNLAGGDCVEDLRVLEGDEGFCKVLSGIENYGLRRKERRALSRRWRKERKRVVPSPSAVFRYLAGFVDEGERKPGAWIPERGRLCGLSLVNRDMLSFVQKNSPSVTATLDMDATLVQTEKMEALYCYKGYKSYQPLNTWWDEQGMVVHTEFRDGNVPAGFEQLRVFKEALECLPEGVEAVRLRSDSAGYQHDLLKFCDSGQSRFGRIEFGISCDMTSEFGKAVKEVEEWHTFKGERQWGEVCFVPNAIGHSKKGPAYRYLAVREPLYEQMVLPGMEQREYSFPVIDMEACRYKVFGYVTNLDWEGDEVIRWIYKRCGKSEEAHAVMKDDFVGGRLPSGDFGTNAAWWWIMMLSLNLNAAMKGLVLGSSWASKRMKAIRFHFINLPGRIIEHARQLIIRLSGAHPSTRILLRARETIAMLASA